MHVVQKEFRSVIRFNSEQVSISFSIILIQASFLLGYGITSTLFAPNFLFFQFMRFSVLLFGFAVMIVASSNVPHLEAATKPKWEMGLGYFDFQTPHYLGSNHVYQYKIPFPRLVYRFDNFELSRNSKYYLLDTDLFQIDIALSGRLPVFSDDADDEAPDNADDSDSIIARTTNYTRRGMSDLPVTVFAGLRFRLFLTDHLILEVPFFHGGKLESGFGHAGNTNSAELRLEIFDRDSKHQFSIVAENLYADEKYNDFYYQVSEKEALPDRPEFDAKAGLVSSSLGLSFWFQLTDRLSVSGGYNVNNMEQSVVKDSPLVKTKTSSEYYFMISYSFVLSDKTVNIP